VIFAASFFARADKVSNLSLFELAEQQFYAESPLGNIRLAPNLDREYHRAQFGHLQIELASSATPGSVPILIILR
jgi:hypothetical protein